MTDILRELYVYGSFGLISTMLLVILYLNTNVHQERMMAKHKRRARQKKTQELIEDAITEALERVHMQGNLKREEVDAAYKDMRSHTRFKTCGPEPSFGRPWYYGPQLPDIQKLKGVLVSRWGRKKEETETSKERILNSLRKPS